MLTNLLKLNNIFKVFVSKASKVLSRKKALSISYCIKLFRLEFFKDFLNIGVLSSCTLNIYAIYRCRCDLELLNADKSIEV